MKIYVVHIDLLEDVDEIFQQLSDEEVVKLCEKDTNLENHDVYDTIEEFVAAWNTDEIFPPNSSYMRVIK